jgi:hypothetical protein
VTTHVDHLTGRRIRPHIGGFGHRLVHRADEAQHNEESQNSDKAPADLPGTCPAAPTQTGWRGGE